MRELHELARASGSMPGMGAKQTALKERILGHEDAVDALVPLLKDPDERVADLAAYVLRDASAIDPRYLPQIREGLDRGLAWLPPALARIGTEASAKEAVDRFLVSPSSPDNQEAYAVELSGKRAIPFMLERARCNPSCAENTHRLLAAVLARMGPARAAAGQELLRLASDRNATPQVARGALLMIASLGNEGVALEPALLHERDASPSLAPWIDEALIGIGSSSTGAIFVERLASAPNLITLRDLAETGSAGRNAGPAVLARLEQDPELEVPAAMTLGFIGYTGAIPKLAGMLETSADPRAAWAAARSLGRLGAREALPSLDRAADHHWYAPVRDEARAAAARIRSGSSATTPVSSRNFIVEFFAFESINRELDDCPPAHEVGWASTDVKLYAPASLEALKRLTYPTEVVSYGAADAEAQKQAGAEIIRVHRGNIVEYRQSIDSVPDVALRVDDGWLVGGSRGEWGGELGFLGDDGRFQRILDTNVTDIHRLGNRIVATVGLAHLASNKGAVMDMTRKPDGEWEATRWRVLPGAPGASIVGPEELVVATVGGGAIAIDEDGTMRMAACPQ